MTDRCRESAIAKFAGKLSAAQPSAPPLPVK